MKIILNVLLITSIILCSIALAITFYLGFDNLLDYFLEMFNKPHKKEEILSILPPSRFAILQVLIGVFIIIQIFLLYKIKKLYLI